MYILYDMYILHKKKLIMILNFKVENYIFS